VDSEEINHPDEDLELPRLMGIKFAVLLMFGGWGVGFGAAGIASYFLGMQGTTAVGNTVGLCLMTFVGVRFSARPAREVLSLKSFSPWLIPPMVLMAFSGSFLVSEVGNLTEEILPVPQELKKMFLGILQADGVEQFLQRAALLSLMAPVTEELMFRGVIMFGLIRVYGGYRGILISSICFGVFHLIPWQAVGATLIGGLLGVMVYRTGSIFAGMAMHAIWNLFPLIVISAFHDMAPEGYGFDSEKVTHVPIPLLILSGGLFYFAFKRFWKLSAQPNEKGFEIAEGC
jgi:membrane protease YdiL (CAAX protease family)